LPNPSLLASDAESSRDASQSTKIRQGGDVKQDLHQNNKKKKTKKKKKKKNKKNKKKKKKNKKKKKKKKKKKNDDNDTNIITKVNTESLFFEIPIVSLFWSLKYRN
jgi:hypothetical protein